MKAPILPYPHYRIPMAIELQFDNIRRNQKAVLESMMEND
jgi:hypothetical protein